MPTIATEEEMSESQANRIKELEDELASTESALLEASQIITELQKEKNELRRNNEQLSEKASLCDKPRAELVKTIQMLIREQDALRHRFNASAIGAIEKLNEYLRQY